jgi:hypothetical protein
MVAGNGRWEAEKVVEDGSRNSCRFAFMDLNIDGSWG